MRQLHNPKRIREALSLLPAKELFSRDYSGEFLLFEYEKDEFVIRQGEVPGYLLFLVSGKLKVFCDHDTGKSVFFNYLRPVEATGLLEAVWAYPAGTNNQAVETSVCLALQVSRVRRELMDDSVFLRYLCSLMWRIVTRSDGLQKATVVASAESRVASALLASEKDGISGISMSAAAEMSSTTYRHVQRIFRELITNGILEKTGKTYWIKKREELEALSTDSFYDINRL